MAPAPRNARRGNSLVVRVGAALAAVALLAGLVLAFLPGLTRSGTTTTTTQATTTAAPPSTVTDAQFLDTVGAIRTLITESGTDRCKLIAAFSAFGSLPRPVNTEQTRNGVLLTAELLTAAADSVGADEAETARALRDTATALLAEAEQRGYDPQWLTSSPGPAALGSESFQQAIGDYQRRSLELCQTDLDNPTGAPGGSTTADTTATTAG